MLVIYCRESNMRSHNHLYPVLNRGTEWLQFHCIEPFAIMSQHRQPQMGVNRRVSMPWKMLNCCNNPGLTQPLYRSCPKLGYQLRIRTKRTHANDRVVGIAVD